MTAGVGRWLAFGAGVGIEVGPADLHVSAARVRPSGARELGALTLEGWKGRPPEELGREYREFLERYGVAHLAATVLLPRDLVTVRLLALPGVARRDLEPAVAYQVDSLHPYPEGEAAWAWARLPGSSWVLVGITRREVLEQHSGVFAQAGIRVASFTFPAAVLYSALRLWSAPGEAVFAAEDTPEGLEIYGESEARPVLSARFQMPGERAAALAASELRLAPGTEPAGWRSLLPSTSGFSRTHAYAAALAGAVPWPALAANLLPPESRQTSSRWMYAPTAALAALLLLVLGALAAQRSYENRRFSARIGAEIARLEPEARKASEADRAIEDKRARVRQLDDFRRRSRADMDALKELTNLLAPPVWLNSLEITRAAVNLSGEAEQAAPLLKTIDGSPLFLNSEFTMPLTRLGSNEAFRIRAQREGDRP